MTTQEANYETILNAELDEIEKAETFADIANILDRLQSDFVILHTAEIPDWLNTVIEPAFNTLSDWKIFACEVSAIPAHDGYFLVSDGMFFKPLQQSDMDSMKELCQDEAEKFAEFLTRG